MIFAKASNSPSLPQITLPESRMSWPSRIGWTMPPASRAQPAEPVLAGRRLRKGQAHRIVFANEKGGTGKSTTAVHVAVALSYLGARVASIASKRLIW